jgi:hypothetical protein
MLQRRLLVPAVNEQTECVNCASQERKGKSIVADMVDRIEVEQHPRLPLTSDDWNLSSTKAVSSHASLRSTVGPDTST